MRTFYSIAFIGILVLAASSCNFINPVEKKPTFIHIDSFQFTGNPNLGSSSHKITNVLVTLDNKTVGYFDLPANVPILMDKEARLALTPGITFSGLNDVQIPYPFYRTDTMRLVPAFGQTITVNPKTSYYADSSFNKLLENFESSTNPFIKLSGDTSMVRDSSANVFEGRYCGRIDLTSKNAAEFILPIAFSGPSETFLELNYKCTMPFIVGIQSLSGSELFVEYLYGFNPNDNWNKVYVGLADFIVQYPDKAYRLVIKAAPKDDKGGTVFLDNIKILSRK